MAISNLSLEDAMDLIRQGSNPLLTATRMPNSNVVAPAGAPGLAPQSRAQSIFDFLGSPGGQTAVNMAGSGLSALGANQSANADRKQSAAQFAASMRQNQFNSDRSDQLNRATGVLNADPLGADQQYAQHNALKAAILSNLRNARSTPGDPRVAGAMGSRTGGVMSALPEQGLDPAMVNSMFGPQATADAIVKRNKELLSVDPNAAQTNLTGLYGDQAAPQQAQIQQWASVLQSKQGAERQALEAHLNQYIQDQAKNSGSGFWHNLAKVAGIVGAGAAIIMTAGGATPLAVAAMGAGSGALSAAGNGQNPLMSAITGGAMGYAGAKFGAPRPGGR